MSDHSRQKNYLNCAFSASLECSFLLLLLCDNSHIDEEKKLRRGKKSHPIFVLIIKAIFFLELHSSAEIRLQIYHLISLTHFSFSSVIFSFTLTTKDYFRQRVRERMMMTKVREEENCNGRIFCLI